MWKILLFVCIAVIFSVVLFRPSTVTKITPNIIDEPPVTSQVGFRLFSPEFRDNSSLPSKYTCDGANVSPPLTISDPPIFTKSLVLIVDDMDTPMGTWVHWLVWNIPPTVRDIPEGFPPPDSVQGKNGFGKNIYGGPCPSSGRHSYIFTLYALNSYINIPPESRKEDVVKAMNTHVLSQTKFTGIYSR